jgi:hypothetical protein
MLSANVKRHGAHHFYESLGFWKHGYSFAIDLETCDRSIGASDIGTRAAGRKRPSRQHPGGGYTHRRHSD